jgi:hypothetical protein
MPTSIHQINIFATDSIAIVSDMPGKTIKKPNPTRGKKVQGISHVQSLAASSPHALTITVRRPTHAHSRLVRNSSTPTRWAHICGRYALGGGSGGVVAKVYL